MNNKWGRCETAGRWLHPKPVCTVAALVVATTIVIAVAAYQYTVAWTPLQRAYLPTYLRTSLMATLAVTQTGRYRLLEISNGRRQRLALEEDVLAQPGSAPALALSAAGQPMGDRELAWRDASFNHAALHTFLQRWVYRDQPVATLLGSAFRTGVMAGTVGLLLAIPFDLARSHRRRHGRRLKGPELVSVKQFNRRTRGNGLAIEQRSRWFRHRGLLRMPRELESSHLLILGDSGTGKSALIRQMLGQLEDRGDSAIVYDPALEYTPQFYAPGRGDVLLNPLDTRCPFWTPGDEWRHEAETLTLATSLFPDRPHENAFFTEAPRRIFAHLLTLRPTPQELAGWLCHDEEIDRRVAGTPYAVMVDRQAAPQRSGVLASLNMVADVLKLLPAEGDRTRRWSAAAWASEWPRGWIFLTSTPETRPRLVPLISLWLDTLILRLMNQGQPCAHRTWFVLDELASLQRLPQLHTAITENRKSNNPLVLGFQGRSQLETRYGHDAEAMLSQPATKIFLRTTEPHAAKWIADTLGDVEIERLRESRSDGRGGRHHFGLERQVEPLVMASEIGGLPALRALVKVGNLVVRVDFPFVSRPNTSPAFLPCARLAPAHRQPLSTDEPATSRGARASVPAAQGMAAPGQGLFR